MRKVNNIVSVAVTRLIMKAAMDIWGSCTIKELGTWATGNGFPLEYQGYSSLPYLFCKVGDMNRPGNDVSITSTANTIDKNIAQKIGVKIYPVGTVIFPKIGGAIATNKRRILAKESAIDNNLLGIVPNKSTDTEWLYHFLKSIDFTTYQMGTSVPAIKQSVIGELRAPSMPLDAQISTAGFLTWFMKKDADATWNNAPTLPSQLAEQHRIVMRIVELAAKIEEARGLRWQAAEEIEAIIKSQMNLMFGSPYNNKSGNLRIRDFASLNDVVIDVADGPHVTPTYVENGVPFVTAQNVTSGRVNFSGLKYITLDDHKQFQKRAKVEKGDVLISKDGTIGFPCYVDTDKEFSFFVSVALIKPKRDILDGQFLTWVLRTPYLQERIRKQSRGDMIRHLVLREIRDLIVPIPPLPEQRRIVAYLDDLQGKVDVLRRLQAETSVELDALLPAVLDRAFKGEL